MNFIKILITSIIVSSLVLTYSCQGDNKTEEPVTIDGIKELLAKKKAELNVLQAEIDQLQEEIVAASPELQEKAKLVDTLVVKTQNFKRFIDIQGKVLADDIVNVVSEVPGRIISVRAEEGEYIQKGQIVATIDLESIRKQKEEINTSLSLATDVYERQKRLWDQNIGSEVQYLQAKNNKERLEQSLVTLDYQLSKSTIYAPISGTVDREVLKSGELASPGMPIITILNTRNIKIESDLPERFLTKLDRGDRVNMNFPSIEKSMSGVVKLMGRSIDPSNRTLKIEITPARYDRLLKPNLLAEIQIEELSIDDVIVLPSVYLLQEVDGQEYVYKAIYDNTEYRTQKTYVKTSESSDGNIIITDGLLPGDLVISKGARNVSDGDLITFQ